MERLSSEIEQSWRCLGASTPPDPAALIGRYAESQRAYHTAEHLCECFAWFRYARDLAERPAELALALAYHDAVYDPLRSDNERQSAALFERTARCARLPPDAIRRIAALIEQTATHRGRTGDAALLNDIDLAIFAASPHGYERYVRSLRREYGHVDDQAFRAGRALVVRGFLERTSIYQTPFFARRLEVHARRNLACELDRLNEGAERGAQAS